MLTYVEIDVAKKIYETDLSNCVLVIALNWEHFDIAEAKFQQKSATTKICIRRQHGIYNEGLYSVAYSICVLYFYWCVYWKWVNGRNYKSNKFDHGKLIIIKGDTFK